MISICFYVLLNDSWGLFSSIITMNFQKPFAPKRYYSIDRVFRNEAVDRTHLAEFHQIEGVFLFLAYVLFCWLKSGPYLGYHVDTVRKLLTVPSFRSHLWLWFDAGWSDWCIGGFLLESRCSNFNCHNNDVSWLSFLNNIQELPIQQINPRVHIQ